MIYLTAIKKRELIKNKKKLEDGMKILQCYFRSVNSNYNNMIIVVSDINSETSFLNETSIEFTIDKDRIFG